MPLVSVIIPTHSPDLTRLQRTLVALAGQNLPKSEWELLLVDNASREPIPAAHANAAHPGARVIRETRLGLTHARLTGLAAALGQIIVFVDDDNVLHEDYLSVAANFLDRHPEVAVAGGVIRGEFESPPPSWTIDHLWSLAVRDYGDRTLVSEYSTAGAARTWPVFCPVGAGMVVRAAAARRYATHCTEAKAVMADRSGRSLGSSGDCELIMHAAFLAGFQVAYTPTLQLTHLIPSRRLGFSYLARLNFESGISWGKFQVAYGFRSRISRASLWLRLPRAFIRLAGWTRRGFVAWVSAAGEFVGRTAAP
ncbi:MAG TPA: glycosyltransferase [Candidatus Limnocylindria bacterium]|jgi:glycosyltransferase involved in cell wall biosynthesis|nr:glycosyltransferase [Candidatus Limnocylindria bacterium]HTL66469.1 glycosyltransferase [Lacunisphaera sp.]